MKTRILLHGGRLKLKDSRNDSYFCELVKDLSDGDQVLFIGFARRDESERLEVYEREKGFLLAQTDKAITVINANYKNLIEQIKAAKVVQITGGESPELVKDLLEYADFLPSLAGKLVGGSSAGACLFSKYYWYGEENVVHQGLDMLPIRLVVHYGSSEYKAADGDFEPLRDIASDLELVTVEECAWVAREVKL
jgi:peptidase E